MKIIYIIGLLIATVSASPVVLLPAENETEINMESLDRIEKDLTHLWEMVHEMEKGHDDGVHIHLKTIEKDGKHRHLTKHLNTKGANDTHVYIHMGESGTSGVGSRTDYSSAHLPHEIVNVEAHCDLMSNDADKEFKGHIHLKQVTPSLMSVDVKLDCPAGVAPGTKLDLHVHEGNDLTERCNSLGGHFNPLGVEHGPRTASFMDRHVGDWGNVVCDLDNKVDHQFYERVAHMAEPHSVLNRSLVIHMATEGHGELKMAAHAGARMACCLIKQKKMGDDHH